jgi:hypothetical protein
MARAYTLYHDETIAVVVCKDGEVLRSYRHPTNFPFIQVSKGQRVPQGSSFHRRRQSPGAFSQIEDCAPEIWIEHERGSRAPSMAEQIPTQNAGFVLILLKLEKPDEEKADEEQMLERSWRVGFHR